MFAPTDKELYAVSQRVSRRYAGRTVTQRLADCLAIEMTIEARQDWPACSYAARVQLAHLSGGVVGIIVEWRRLSS